MMKRLVYIVFFTSLNICAQNDKIIYKISEVTSAPILPNCITDSITNISQDQFKKCIFHFINKNIEILTGPVSKQEKAYVEIVIDENGLSEITNSMATTKKAEKKALKVVSKLPKFIPATLSGKNVKTVYAIPIKFNIIVIN